MLDISPRLHPIGGRDEDKRRRALGIRSSSIILFLHICIVRFSASRTIKVITGP